MTMDPHWRDLLAQAGAVFGDGAVAHFGDPQGEARAAAEALVLADLSHRGLLKVTGEDAADFLQNLLCNDLRQVDAHRAQLTGLCNPKGRLLALFRVFLHEDAYWLDLPASQVEAVLGRLRLYVLRSRVSLEAAGGDLARLGLAGPRAAERLAAVLGTAPTAPMAVARKGRCLALRLHGPKPRFAVYGPPAALAPLWERLAAEARPVGEDAWELTRVLAGVPEIFPETREAFVPQMVNLEPLEGLSYRKGCYPGQEVVARTHYLGKLKRRMDLARVAGGERPAPGDPVYAAGEAQAAGKVVDARPDGRGGLVLLVVLQLSARDAALHLGAPEGPRLELLELPYPPPEAAAAGA